LATGLVQPTEMELTSQNADGRTKQLTNLKCQLSPFFHPSGKQKKSYFSSNFELNVGFPLIYTLSILMVKNLERTHGETLMPFPFLLLAKHGKYLAFSLKSVEITAAGRDTNLFIAEWKD
jgi:hypothetical protein